MPIINFSIFEMDNIDQKRSKLIICDENSSIWRGWSDNLYNAQQEDAWSRDRPWEPSVCTCFLGYSYEILWNRSARTVGRSHVISLMLESQQKGPLVYEKCRNYSSFSQYFAKRRIWTFFALHSIVLHWHNNRSSTDSRVTSIPKKCIYEPYLQGLQKTIGKYLVIFSLKPLSRRYIIMLTYRWKTFCTILIFRREPRKRDE